MRLYALLNRQHALRRRALDVPLIRLEDGSHVRPFANGWAQAFLPSAIETDFPTARGAVCASEEALEFLTSLGLRKPDPVDDVVRNVLPKYKRELFQPHDAEYEADIQRIATAFQTDSQAKRDELLAELRATRFVRTVDLGDGSISLRKPTQVYLATDQVKNLFASVAGVLMVDDSYSYFRGEQIRKLLEAVGCTRYLREVDSVEGITLSGLDALLRFLAQSDVATRTGRAGLLWEALRDLGQRRVLPDRVAFLRKLNEVAWVPDASGALHVPSSIVFESLRWASDPVLLSKIHFKPSTVEALAKEVGIEPGVLDLLKKLGLTSEAELRSRLGIADDIETVEAVENVERPAIDVSGNSEQEADPTEEESGGSSGPPRHSSKRSSEWVEGSAGSGMLDQEGAESASTSERTSRDGDQARPEPRETDQQGSLRHGARTREFVSYVAVHPDEDEKDPDGLKREARVALEESAIRRILRHEPQLRRTPTDNPGYDLFEADETGRVVRWIEVKAMTRDLSSRPVGLSRTQFDWAREHGEDYWLYIVENAADSASAQVLRIQDPSGKAQTFTFDRGWRNAAVS